MSELNCTEYVLDGDEGSPLCRCPICKGFLPRDISHDNPFNCKKCGAELILMPDHDEETKEEMEYGRICPIKLGDKKRLGST